MDEKDKKIEELENKINGLERELKLKIEGFEEELERTRRRNKDLQLDLLRESRRNDVLTEQLKAVHHISTNIFEPEKVPF